MDEPRARVAALVGEWLLEASVLVAVFPAIDQNLSTVAVRWRVIIGADTFALLALATGIWLRRRR